MIYGLLFLSIILGPAQEFIKKSYLLKYKNGNKMAYNFWSVLGAIPIFLVSAGGTLEFHLPTLGYSCLYALGYSAALIFSMKALAEGSMALTLVLLSFATVIPIIFGIIALHEPITILGVVAILLLIAALIFIVGPDKTEEGRKITFKWLFYVLLGVLGNGSCSVVVKLHRIQYPGKYSSELMIFALFIVLIVCGVLAFFSIIQKAKTFAEQPVASENIKATIIFALVTGILNGAVNLIVVILAEMMPLSSQTLFTKVGRLTITYLVSVYIFREKFSQKQKLGLILGITSAVLFNIKL